MPAQLSGAYGSLGIYIMAGAVAGFTSAALAVVTRFSLTVVTIVVAALFTLFAGIAKSKIKQPF